MRRSSFPAAPRQSSLGMAMMEANRTTPPVFYRTIQVDGLSVFYREAGSADAPTLLLLHGFPSSSRMYESLLARLSDQFHLVAPDYPGFGHSDAPDPKTFAYTFDHLAEIIGRLTETLRLSRYALYLQDYGGPVGFRLALAHPERLEALVIQNAVAHADGLGPSGRGGAPSGPVRGRTRRRSERIFSPLPRRVNATSAPAPTSRTTTPTFGPTNSPS